MQAIRNTIEGSTEQNPSQLIFSIGNSLSCKASYFI